jgi:seryl-tRNA synthetase
MTNKPTDNEIIKALRCCADKYCKGCTEQGKPNCRESVAALAWDLMYRQKEDNERLYNENEALISTQETLQKHIEKQNAENEELEIKLKHFAEFLAEAERKNEELKAEIERLRMGEYRHIGKTVKNAYREGIEAVFDRLRNIISLHTEKHIISLGLKDIDLIELEMVGESV